MKLIVSKRLVPWVNAPDLIPTEDIDSLLNHHAIAIAL